MILFHVVVVIIICVSLLDTAVTAQKSLGKLSEERVCDPTKVNLLRFEPWKREQGIWIGNYSFYGADGFPFLSPSWPYPYQPYKGFIIINILGNHLSQKNIFVYPPKSAAECLISNHTVGDGVCGVNGNEKIFSADQYASDCDGNLAGPYQYGQFTLDTTTTIFGNDTVLYQVRYRETNIDTPYFKLHLAGGSFNQNQLTTLPGNGIRVRTAHAFNADQSPQAASYYREKKVSITQWLEELNKVRAEFNILESDECSWDQFGAPSGVTCNEHFGFSLNNKEDRQEAKRKRQSAKERYHDQLKKKNTDNKEFNDHA